MASRSFSVFQVFAVDHDGDVLFIGFDELARAREEGAEYYPATEIGKCNFSFYRIRQLSDQECLLHRSINIDLNLMFRDSWVAQSYADNYLKDLESLRTSASKISDALSNRLNTEEIYKEARARVKINPREVASVTETTPTKMSSSEIVRYFMNPDVSVPSGDANKGEALFKSRCAMCHTYENGKPNKSGMLQK